MRNAARTTLSNEIRPIRAAQPARNICRPGGYDCGARLVIVAFQKEMHGNGENKDIAVNRERALRS